MWIYLLFSTYMGFQFQPEGRDPGEHVNAILQILVVARGEDRDDYPEVKITSRIKNIASYSPGSNEIFIERKAYDICRSMGERTDDALAFLIGHELTHYFQHKAWNTAQQVSYFYQEKSQFVKMKSAEAEADRYGAFQAYLAGYNYFDVAPDLISRLYQAYRIDPLSSQSYPSTEERSELTLSVCSFVRDLTLLFETANYLQMIGRYEWSQSIYEYLLRYIDLPELYNNAGLNQLKAALSVTRPNAVYPLHILHEFTLREGLSAEPDDLLNQAFENLKKAALKTPSNHEIFINLAVGLIELGRFQEARAILDQLDRLSTSNIIEEQVAFLYCLLTEDDITKLDALERLLPMLKDDVMIINCRKTIERIAGAKSQDIRIHSFPVAESNFEPQTSLECRRDDEILIDGSDILFPLKACLAHDEVKHCRLYKGSTRIDVAIAGPLEQPAGQSVHSIIQNKDGSIFSILAKNDNTTSEAVIAIKR